MTNGEDKSPEPAPEEAPEQVEKVESAATSSKDERLWHMLTHLSGVLIVTTFPLLNVIGPFAIWQIKKADMPSIEAHGKEALNFQITIAVCVWALMALGKFLIVILVGAFFYIAAGIVALCGIVFSIIAGLKANEGTLYRYPLSIRLIK